MAKLQWNLPQVTPGVDGQKASPQEIGAATYKALTRVVPPAVPGQPSTRQQLAACMFRNVQQLLLVCLFVHSQDPGTQLLRQPRSAVLAAPRGAAARMGGMSTQHTQSSDHKRSVSAIT